MNIVGNGRPDGLRISTSRHQRPQPIRCFGTMMPSSRKRMMVAPDSEGRVKQGRENTRRRDMGDAKPRAPQCGTIRFNSQPLAVAFTDTRTIGGTGLGRT